MSKRLETTTNYFLLLTCALLSVLVGMRLWNDRVQPAPRGSSPVEDLASRGLVTSIAGNATHGASTAKVALIEFSDFQCPFCAKYAAETYADLQRAFVDTGKVRYVFRNLPLASHPAAFDAAKAAECAHKQGRYFEMRRELFEHRAELSAETLTRLADSAKLNVQDFAGCMSSQDGTSILTGDKTEAKRLGITSTPTFLVGTFQNDGRVKLLQQINGAQPFAVFKAILDKAAVEQMTAR